MGLKKNIVYSGILTTANYIFPLITYPYVSRVLGVNNIGICDFVDSIVNYFVLFSMLGVNIMGIREIAKCNGDSNKINTTFNSILVLNTLSTSVVAICLIIAIYCVPKLYEYKGLMWIGVVKLMFNYLAVEWLYKGLENFKFITTRSIVVRCIYVFCVFIFVRTPNDFPIYYLLLVGMVVANAVVGITHARHYVSFTLMNIEIKQYVKPFFSLGFYSLLTTMYTSFNVVYLGFVSTPTEVGYYTTATKLHAIFLAMYTAFTGVMMPRMSSLVSEGRMDEFKRLLSKSVKVLFLVALPIMAVAMIFAPQIIDIVAGNGYEGAIAPMRIVMPLILIVGYEQILVIQVLMPLKEDAIILRNSMLGAIVGVVGNIILVPHYACVGSAIVWVISELVVLCSSQYYVSKQLKIRLKV